MTYKEIIKNKEINAYLKKGNENLGQLGYTDHSQKHCMQVAIAEPSIATTSGSQSGSTDITMLFKVTSLR